MPHFPCGSTMTKMQAYRLVVRCSLHGRRRTIRTHELFFPCVHRTNVNTRHFAAAAATSRQKKAGVVDARRTTEDTSAPPRQSIITPSPRRLILPSSPTLNRSTNWNHDDDDYEASVDHPLLYDAHTTKQLHWHTLPQNWIGYEVATPLWNHLLALMSVTGRPISFATYMKLCLTHPQYGYYTTNNPNTLDHNDDDDFSNSENDSSSQEVKDNNLDEYMIGRDFVTAPEISQVFGECLAVWFRTQWDRSNHNPQHRSKEVKSNSHPRKWQWIECGPGKGSLMVDLIKASFQLEFGVHCQAIHLIETSPVLRTLQRQTLQSQLSDWVQLHFASNIDPNDTIRLPKEQQQPPTPAKYDTTLQVHWHDSFLDFVMWQRQQPPSSSSSDKADNDDGGNDPVLNFVVCQEFVDALPVYSFQKTKEGWRERLIDLAISEDYLETDDGSNNNSTNPNQESDNTMPSNVKKPRLRVVLAPELTPPTKALLHVNDTGFMPHEDPTTNIGSIVEINPEGILLVQDIADLLSSSGGAALIVDYGHEGSTDSIRGYYRHEQVPFLSLPGQVDVTADVDFSALAHAVNHRSSTTTKDTNGTTQAYGPVTQGEFLMAMGLQERVLSVIEHEQTTDDDAENLYQAMVRLASPGEMGERFKVLAIVKTDDASSDERPPGFDQSASTASYA